MKKKREELLELPIKPSLTFSLLLKRKRMMTKISEKRRTRMKKKMTRKTRRKTRRLKRLRLHKGTLNQRQLLHSTSITTRRLERDSTNLRLTTS